MTGTATQWLPAAAALAVGIAIGAAFVLRSRRTRASAAPSPLAAAPEAGRAELEARRDELLERLRGLATTDEEDRGRLELEAAGVLRELEATPAAIAATDAATTPAAPGNPAMRGFLWGMGTMACLALLVWWAARSAAPRPADQPATGEVPRASAAPPGIDETQLAALERAVAARPDDADARIELAGAYLVREDLMKVFEHTKHVLDRQPEHPRALAYQALVRLAMQQGDKAQQMLERALATDPQLLEGWIHLAVVHAELGRPTEAKKALDEAARRHPERAAMLHELGERLRQRSSETTASGVASAGDPHDGADPAMPGADAGPGVSGLLELEPASAKRVRPGTTVFVVARSAGGTAGPPVAVKRITAQKFPLAFALGPADSMLGQPLPQRLRIEARVDSDGDPLSRDPQDPSAIADSVALGTRNLRLVLRQ